jgi:hypothetical protein
MSATEQLRSNLWGVDIEHGVMNIKNGTITCFMIVEHHHDLDFIRKAALSLVVAGCNNFIFYGQQESIWHLETDMADIKVHPDSDEVDLTSSCKTLDDFIEEIGLDIDLSPLVPNYNYIIYDDEGIYREILRRLKIS